MKGVFCRSLPIVVVSLMFCASGCASNIYTWTKEEMTPSDTEEADDSRGSWLKNVRLDSVARQAPNAACGTNECFDLYYFKGDHYNGNDTGRKNILFIAGGPGQIPQRFGESASFLERNHNLIYFDVRGSGLSPIPLENSYDKYLRAKFVVGDIEQLRKEILGKDGKWDAIIGLSYGSLVAQVYAHKHAAMVQRLILISPVDRHHNTQEGRKRIVFDNLDNIYNLIRSKDPSLCDCRKKVPLKVSFIPFPTHAGQATLPTDNFCFLDPGSFKAVRDNVERIYDKLEAFYGSINIVTQNLEDLTSDASFKKSFPYPKEFFIALRQLQLLGMPSEDEESIFFEEQINSLVNASLVVGYYSMLEERQLVSLDGKDSQTCQISTPFFESIKDSPVCAGDKGYCTRLNDAKVQLQPEKKVSARALYVYGVYDGIFEWIFRILNRKLDSRGCIKGQDVEYFAEESEEEYGVLRKLAKKIGNVLDEDVCPWNPSEHAHAVQTLILKGGADPIIGGCQAEDFFNNGLTEGNRIIIEFPALGHVPAIRFENPLGGGKTDQGRAYVEMVEKFLNSSVAKFQNDIKSELAILKAKDRTPQQGMRVKCRG
jgi:pimeloyl-ACP methyl ester carboxylesterase